MRVEFKMEKATKNTIRFEEILESELSAPKVGSVYIPKSTLGEIGWKEGQKLILEVSTQA
jgi:hypothetical protein